MNLGATVAFISGNVSMSRNVYNVNNHATSTKHRKRKRRLPRRPPGSSSASSRSSTDPQLDPTRLYELSSQNCPCAHHRLARIREQNKNENEAFVDYGDVDSFVVSSAASFQEGLAPYRGGLPTSSSSTGDSGVNSNSNGSRRSSGRGAFERRFSSACSSSSSEDSDLVEAVTTTVILEQNGCEATTTTTTTFDARHHHQQQQKSVNVNRATQKSEQIQISPDNDPSNNWTLKPVFVEYMSSINEEEDIDSLFSRSLKTSHSSSLKAICTCHATTASIEGAATVPEPPQLIRVASYPRGQPRLDPHRFSLNGLRQPPLSLQGGLRQLPTVPPLQDQEAFFWPRRPPRLQQQSPAALLPEFQRRYSSPINASYPILTNRLNVVPIINSEKETANDNQEIPPCVRNVILQQLHCPPVPPQNAKMMKKLSKAILLPEDPHDPTAFTVSYDRYMMERKKKKKSRRSMQVVKIVGTFSFLMTVGIITTVVCFFYWSDTFKPMTMM